MSLMVSPLAQTAQINKAKPAFKGDSSNELLPKSEDSKLTATLACLATLGAGAVATAYAFKKGKLSGKLVGLKEGKAAGIQIGKSTAGKAAVAAEKAKVRGPLKVNPMYDIRPVKFKRPDGSLVEGTEFKKNILLNGESVTVTKVVDSETGRTLSIKGDRRRGIDNLVTVKEHIIENGQKVTKKHEYRDGKLQATISSVYDKKTGVLKKSVSHGENPSYEDFVMMKDKNGYNIRLQYANNSGKPYIEAIWMQDPKGNHMLDYYGNSKVAEALAVLKEHNLPFEI